MKVWDFANLTRLAAYLGIVGLFLSIVVGASLSRKAIVLEDAVPAFSHRGSPGGTAGDLERSGWRGVVFELLNSRYALSILRTGLPSLSIVRKGTYSNDGDISLWNLIGYCVAGVRMNDPGSILASAIPGLKPLQRRDVLAGLPTGTPGLSHENGVLEGPEEGGVEPGDWRITDDGDEGRLEEASLLCFGKKSPVVIVYHTHAREAYLPAMGGAPIPDRAFSFEPEKGVLGVGERIVKSLWRRHGIPAGHCRIVHDKAGRLGAYTESMRSLDKILQNYPDIGILLDVHRDSLRKAETTAVINGKSAARTTIVIGDKNEHWEENYEIAQKLVGILQKKYPGLNRTILKKPYTYNQMVSSGCLLIEIGGVDNTLEEVNYTADMVADAIAELLRSL